MAKIDRYDGNVEAFAADSLGTERTIFGDTAQSNTLDGNITADFLRGWGIVGVNENPTKQDFNGLAFTLGQLISYLHQRGVAEWNTSQEYYEGSVVTTLDGIYKLKAGGNGTVNPDTDAGVNWEKAPTRTEIEDRVIRVTSIAAMEAYSAPVGYVFSLNAGGRSGVFDVVAGDFSAELAADVRNALYVGLADDTSATTKVAKRSDSGFNAGWWGIVPEVDATARFNDMHDMLPQGTTVNFNSGEYRMNVLNENLQLKGTGDTRFVAHSLGVLNGFCMSLGYHTAFDDWSLFKIEDIDWSEGEVGTSGVTHSEPFAGRWWFSGCSFKCNNICIEKPLGNIGNVYTGVTFNGGNYHLFAKGNPSGSGISPLNHTGADYWERPHFRGAKLASVYIDDGVDGSGQLVMVAPIFEQNAGFAIFIKNFLSPGRAQFAKTKFISPWFESNATAGSVTIEGTSYTPRANFRIENSVDIEFDGVYLRDFELINSVVDAPNCRVDTDYSGVNYLVDDNSYLRLQNVSSTRDHTATANGVGNLYAESFLGVPSLNHATSGRVVGVFKGPPRANTEISSRGIVSGNSYLDASTIIWEGVATFTGTVINEGPLGSCNRFNITDGPSFRIESEFSLTADKYYVLGITVRTEQKVNIRIPGVTDYAVASAGNGFETFTAVWEEKGSGAVKAQIVYNEGVYPFNLDLSSYQVVEFDTRSEAMEFINSKSLRYV